MIVEIASRTTWRCDRNEKRSLYMDAGVPEYWIVDGKERVITVVKPNIADTVVQNDMRWHPDSVSEPLTFNLAEVFGLKKE